MRDEQRRLDVPVTYSLITILMKNRRLTNESSLKKLENEAAEWVKWLLKVVSFLYLGSFLISATIILLRIYLGE